MDRAEFRSVFRRWYLFSGDQNRVTIWFSVYKKCHQNLPTATNWFHRGILVFSHETPIVVMFGISKNRWIPYLALKWGECPFCPFNVAFRPFNVAFWTIHSRICGDVSNKKDIQAGNLRLSKNKKASLASEIDTSYSGYMSAFPVGVKVEDPKVRDAVAVLR